MAVSTVRRPAKICLIAGTDSVGSRFEPDELCQ